MRIFCFEGGDAGRERVVEGRGKMGERGAPVAELIAGWLACWLADGRALPLSLSLSHRLLPTSYNLPLSLTRRPLPNPKYPKPPIESLTNATFFSRFKQTVLYMGMPQLVPFYWVNEATFGFIILPSLIYVFSKYLLPQNVRRMCARLFISKL